MLECLSQINESDEGRDGQLICDYQKLVDIMGEPNRQDDPDKVDASWGVQHDDGRKLFVWNYKNGQAYNGPTGCPVKDIKNWSFGGEESLAIELFGEESVC